MTGKGMRAGRSEKILADRVLSNLDQAAASRKAGDAVAHGVGLVAACDAGLLGLELWPSQRDLLVQVEAGPRLHVWALGRRSGKTTLAAVVGLWDCLLRPELADAVRPNERRYSVCVATRLRQARLFVQAAASIVQSSPLLRGMVESISEDEIRFRNNTALAAFPCTARGVRGWAISTLLLDEAAHFVSDTEGPAVAERVFNALMPATLQFNDHARILVCSTPYGSDGFFANLHQQASSGELAGAHAVQATTQEMNPSVDEAFLQRERARDPVSFLSEYEARFVGGGASYLDPERIADSVRLPGELHPGAASNWIAGLDPAFSRDPFGLCIVGSDLSDRWRLVLGTSRSWTPTKMKLEGGFEERRATEDRVLREVAEVCLRYRVSRVVTDQYAAPQVVKRLRDAGLAVFTRPMSAATKTETYAELRSRLNLGELDLYEQSDLLAELRRLRTKYSAGSASVVNPRVGGSHGDLAQALAMAVWEHRRGGFDASVMRDYDDHRYLGDGRLSPDLPHYGDVL